MVMAGHPDVSARKAVEGLSEAPWQRKQVKRPGRAE